MGGLFSEKISSAKDIHLCLTLLLDGEKRFGRLCAIHALLVQANDKLCKNRNLPALMHFKDDITYISEESGEYIWATDPQSKSLINVGKKIQFEDTPRELTLVAHRISLP